MSSRFVSNNIRLAVVKKVMPHTGVMITEWIDGQVGIPGPTVSANHLFTGDKGEGIFVGSYEGMIIAFGMLNEQVYVPLATIPKQRDSFDFAEISEIDFDGVGFPVLKPGEIILKGRGGSKVGIDQKGNISIKNNEGEGIFISNDSSSNRCSIKKSLPTEYIVSEAGIHVEGIIRRDLRPNNIPVCEDHLYDPNFEYALEEVGWNPNKDLLYLNNKKKSYKNPGLIENRSVVLEFGRDWNIRSAPDEKKDLYKYNSYDINDRNRNRSDVLDISFINQNTLIETIQGTVVDVFGNILDLNKNIIPAPKEDNNFIDTVFENIRHTIAFSMEMNSRKGYLYNTNGDCVLFQREPNINSSANNAKDRSKWALRVDKEGLTVVNIPASSETGNIPRLLRSETSNVVKYDDKDSDATSDKNNKIIENEERRDMFLEQIGPGGIDVVGNEIPNRFADKEKPLWEGNKKNKFEKYIQVGTAYHNITNVASVLLKNDINKKSSDYKSSTPVTPGNPAVSNKIITSVPEGNVLPNAGGRSLVMNLDGSLETSIGSNTIDRVSLILDTAGGVVSHLGRDKNGRSAIIQSDGEFVFELGGYDFIGEEITDQADTRFVGGNKNRQTGLPNDNMQFRSGKLIIRIRRSNPLNPKAADVETQDNLLIFDDNGLTIKTSGRINFICEEDMNFEAGGSINFESPNIVMYNKSMPRYVTKKPSRL